ncbi:MAG: phosphatase PAP2 family protein [Halanaerobiales bacterium]|nr:phosphatase PAP2 family protein [Halanaerobiales bacterium]
MQKFSHKLIAVDNLLFYSLNSLTRNDIIDNFFLLITHLGGVRFLSLLTIFLIFLSPDSLPVLGWELAAVLSSSHLCVHILKRLINRKRPYTRLADVKHLVMPFEPYSFPSGHTTASFAAALILSFAVPQLSILFIFTASLVGVSRIYLGVHYPSDVLIGIITAVIFSFAVHNLFV